MAMKLTSGKSLVYALTSPPDKPTFEPDEKLVAKVMEYQDRKVFVTVPFPDSVEMRVRLRNEHQIVPDQSLKSIKLIYEIFDEEILQALKQAAATAPDWITGGVNKTSQRDAHFDIGYDPDQPLHRGHVSFYREEIAKLGYPRWRMKIEFSADKAGPTGQVKLIAAIDHLLGNLIHIGRMLSDMEMSRVDAAVDLVGASPIDLIGHIHNPGKRMVFVGDRGKPESTYFYERKAPPEHMPKNYSYLTRGPLRMLIYERRAHMLQHGQSPTYGGCPCSRTEVSKRWNNYRPLLRDLHALPNFFIGRRVAYAAAVAGMASKAWKQFCYAAFGSGSATAMFSWLPGSGGKYEKAYMSCPGDLVSEECWSGWSEGLKITGMETWVLIAQGKHDFDPLVA